MSEENSWLGRRVAVAGAALLTAGALACATPALADTASTGQAAAATSAGTGAVELSQDADTQAAESQGAADGAQAGTPVSDASAISALRDAMSGEPPALPDDNGENPRPGMDPVGAPEKRHGAADDEVLPPAEKVDPECAPADNCVTLWVWGASMMVDPDITIRQMNAWRAQAAQKGAHDAEGNAITGNPLVWSDSLAFAAQELAVELALGGGDAGTLERLDGSGSVVAGEGNTFFSKTNITGVNVSNLTSVQGALDAWYVESDAYWYGPTSNVYYLTGEYANAVSNDAKAVGMAAVMLSNQEVYIVCVFGDDAPETDGDATYAPTTGGAIYQGVNVLRDNLSLQLVAPDTLTAGQPVELGINATTSLSGNAVGRENGVAIDSTELLAQADVQVVQNGAVIGRVVDGVLQAEDGFASGTATLQVVTGTEVVATAEVNVVAVPEEVDPDVSFDVTVASGGTPELPQTATVVWSGGATTEEPVTWGALTDEQLAVIAGREGGEVEVAGTVEKTGEAVSATVTVDPATPVSAEAPAAQEIWVGGTPEFPDTVAVTWSNGDVTDGAVSWGEVDASVPGELEVSGTVAGLAEPVVAQVTVKALEVAEVQGQDYQYTAQSAPSEMAAMGLADSLEGDTAFVTWSDGSVTEEPIAWDDLTPEQEAVLSAREGGSFTLYGTVGDTGRQATMQVTVDPAVAVSAAEVPSQEVWVGHAPNFPVTVAVTWSNGDVTDEPVVWGDVDTSQPGAVVAQGTVACLADPVETTVEVKALEAENVNLAQQVADVPSGTTAQDALAALPQTASVTWSDGSVTEEPVAWPDLTDEQLAALASREGGTIELVGTVGETGQTVDAALTVAPATPVSAEVAPIEGDVWVGGTVELPQTATVTWSNGDVTEEPVAWGVPDTTQAGTCSVQGTVDGLAEPVAVSYEVKQPEPISINDAQPIAASVPAGTAAADAVSALPSTVPVTWSDGSVTDESVAWADPTADQAAVLSGRDGGTVELTGTVGATGQSVSATIEVAPATVSSVQAPSVDDVWVGDVPQLPATVSVTWSNGDVTDEPVTWEDTDTSQAGTVSVQGTVAGVADPVTATFEVKQPEATAVELISPDDETALEVEPGQLPQLPETAQVIWSNGETTQEAVTWDMPKTSEFEAGTDVDVSGEVQAAQQDVEVTVHVKEEEKPVAVDPAADEASDEDEASSATAEDDSADAKDAAAVEAAAGAQGEAAAQKDADSKDAVDAQNAAAAQGAVDAAKPAGDSKKDVADQNVTDSVKDAAGTGAASADATSLSSDSASEEPSDSAGTGTGTAFGTQGSAAQTPSATTPAAGASGTETPSGSSEKSEAAQPPAGTTSPAPSKTAQSASTSSTSQQQTGLPAWVIATLAGLGAAFVAAVAFIVAKRRHADEDDEPIGKHAAPKAPKK